MRRQPNWTIFVCTILCALLSVGAAPKKKRKFKPVRQSGISDSPAPAKNEATPEATPSYSKIAPSTRAASVMVIDARSGEIF